MVKRELDGLHITVLVNNVGGGIKNPLMGDFTEYSPRQNTEAVSKESLFAMHLMHVLLLQFREKHGDAPVVSVGSMVDMGMPLTAIYSASKAFNKTLFEALALEGRLAQMQNREGTVGKRRDVEIMYVQLGNMTNGCGQSAVTAYWAHELLRLAGKAMPTWLR